MKVSLESLKPLRGSNPTNPRSVAAAGSLLTIGPILDDFS
ncbi:MAG: hypothetical protein JWO97_28 [Acidobacteria bacterium]|nr:hypothetical protein [Acidobacteriota bacterium]